jgi:hypothetical protein
VEEGGGFRFTWKGDWEDDGGLIVQNFSQGGSSLKHDGGLESRYD